MLHKKSSSIKTIAFLVMFILCLNTAACSQNKGAASTPTKTPEQTSVPTSAPASDPTSEPTKAPTAEPTKELTPEPSLSPSFNQSILTITSYDGISFKGKLTLPSGDTEVSKLVIYVNGSGATTYDNKREGFNYFDFFADSFSKNGVAFFSYNTRGCDIGETPPIYVDINEEEYQTYLPLNTVEDVYAMIKAIKANDRMKNCKVYLLGWSEGTIVAPLVAKKYPELVDGLLLAGFTGKSFKDVVYYQTHGGISMSFYRGYFPYDEQGRITKDAFLEDKKGLAASLLQNAPFEMIDTNRDGFLSEEDFTKIYADLVGYSYEDLIAAIDRNDDKWLRANYGGGVIPLTCAWFQQHFILESNFSVLPTLDLPITIFQGNIDQNVDFRDALILQEDFRKRNKINLTVNIFDLHNHDLNYELLLTEGKVSEGLQAILDSVSRE